MTTSTNPTDKPIVGREYYHRNGVIPDMVVLYVGEKLVRTFEDENKLVSIELESYL